MALDIVSDELGLWRDPQWVLGTPGVYALVAGASYYPHLKGGKKPAPETYNLEQLYSSATTAADFFQWLRNVFTVEGLPVVWCYLLLSPTETERADFESSGLVHYATPNDAALRRAIQLWAGLVPKGAPESKHSRTLFFFSGHGVQATHKTILLPSDYLNPEFGEPVFENCVGAYEMWQWMEQSPVAEHLALIDACRNEFPELADKASGANSVFPRNPPGGASKRIAACLFGTSENQVAYQLEGRPYTLFGQAMLECVKGRADQSDSRIELDELAVWVKKRVPSLLKDAGFSNVDQRPRLRMDGDLDLVITELPGSEEATSFGLEAMRTTGLPVPDVLASVEEALDDRFDGGLRVAKDISLESLSSDWNEAHRRFGHEFATHPWFGQGIDLRSLVDGSSRRDGATVRVVERNEQSSVVQVDLALAVPPPGALLVFQDGIHVQRGRLGVCMPTDQREPVPIRLTLTITEEPPEGEHHQIRKLVAQLGPCDWNEHYQYLWSLFREADLGSLRKAAERADPERLKSAAQAKRQSAIAATAGMLLLARAGAISRVADWTRNLMNWFPHIPDGAVLWAESLRDAVLRGEQEPFGLAEPFEDMAAALETLSTRGLPFFSDALELADTLVRYTLRQNISSERHVRLEEVARLIDRALGIAMPGGHFLVIPGLPRPDWLGQDADVLTVDEMLVVLGRQSRL